MSLRVLLRPGALAEHVVGVGVSPSLPRGGSAERRGDVPAVHEPVRDHAHRSKHPSPHERGGCRAQQRAESDPAPTVDSQPAGSPEAERRGAGGAPARPALAPVAGQYLVGDQIIPRGTIRHSKQSLREAEKRNAFRGRDPVSGEDCFQEFRTLRPARFRNQLSGLDGDFGPFLRAKAECRQPRLHDGGFIGEPCPADFRPALFPVC